MENNKREEVETNQREDIGVIYINEDGLTGIDLKLSDNLLTQEEHYIMNSCTSIIHNILAIANLRLQEQLKDAE